MNIQEKINDLINDLTSNLEILDNVKLMYTEQLVKELCHYYNNIYMQYNSNKFAEKNFISDYYNMFLDVRKQRGYKNYDKIKLSNNSIGLFELKRNMSFGNKTGLVGANKGVIVELAKRRENSFEVRLLNYPYADIPTIRKSICRIINEKQIKYFCKPMDVKNEN